MIRLTITGATAQLCQALTSRLRGAVLEVAPTSEALPTGDGAVFFGARGERKRIERFLHAGKHVLATADAAWSWEDIQALTELANRAGVGFAIVNPDRYLPSRQLIRQHLDAGKLGAAGLIRIHRWTPAASPASRLSDLDLALWYFRHPPSRVYAVEYALGVQIHLGFPGGGMALLDQSSRLSASNTYYYLSVIGSSGAAYADDHQNMQLLFQGGVPQAIRTEEGVAAYAALVQDFIDRINRRDLTKTQESWRDVFAADDAVRQSLRTRDAVEMEVKP